MELKRTIPCTIEANYEINTQHADSAGISTEALCILQCFCGHKFNKKKDLGHNNFAFKSKYRYEYLEH